MYYIIHEQCLHAKVVLGVGHESEKWGPNGFFGIYALGVNILDLNTPLNQTNITQIDMYEPNRVSN